MGISGDSRVPVEGFSSVRRTPPPHFVRSPSPASAGEESDTATIDKASVLLAPPALVEDRSGRYRDSGRRRAQADVAPAEQALLAERVAVIFLLEQSGVVGVGGEAHPVALDRGDEAGREVMVMVLVRAAVGLGQLDPVALDRI